MIITPATKIGAVIKDNPRAIETLISLSPHFKKLQNPFLRRLLAPRVTIAEAAVIGECPVERILDNLALIGFEVKPGQTEPEAAAATTDTGAAIELVVSHDARPQLAAGEDPLNAILKKLAIVKPNETMLVINSFEPAPLIRLLKSKGYLITVSKKKPGLVFTYITNNNESASLVETEPSAAEDSELFDNVLQHYNLKFTEVDVREMEMPQPMITILDELEHLQSWEALYVRHKRVPVYLLPELKERNFSYVYRKMESEVVILIYPSYTCN
jgi:uncharacterized protein (DUF2249 family)